MNTLNVDFWLFRCSQMVTKLGYYASSFAVIWWVLDQYHSASYVTIVLASSMLVGMSLRVILSPLGDRFDKKIIVLLGTFIQFFAYFAVCLLLLTYKLNMASIYTIELLSAIGASFVEIGSVGMLPMLVKRKDMLEATKIIAGLDSIVMIIGSSLGGSVLAFFGVLSSFIFYSAMLFISIFMVVMMKLHPTEDRIVETKKNNFFKELQTGFLFTFKNKITRVIFIFSLFIGMAFSCLQIIIPYIIKTVNDLPADYLGYIVSSLGVGVVLSSMVIGLLMRKMKNRIIVYAASVFFVVSTVIITFTANPFMYMLAYFLMGMSKNVINIIVDTNLLIFLPPKNRTKVLSNIVFCSNLAMPVTLFFSGEVIDAVGPAILMGFIIVFFILSFLFIAASSGVGEFLDANSATNNHFFDESKERI